jgi:cytochrome c oxidase assembly factor CtaG
MGHAMSTGQVLLTAWDWEPSVVIGCAALLALYFWKARPRQGWRTVLYVGGVSVLLLALVSPIDTLGDTYLFSVHMVQHLLLILVVAPLLVAGMPRQFVERLLQVPRIRAAERVLSHPAISWTSQALALALWHVPLFYNFALANESVHIVEHLIFLVTAVMFWWPVLTPVPSLRLAPGPTVVYLFSAGLFNTILGIIITFAPIGIYPAYVHPQDPLGILPLIRNQWGLWPRGDQELGGLLMWVPAGLIYLVAIVTTVAQWQATPEADELEISPAVNSAPERQHA